METEIGTKNKLWYIKTNLIMMHAFQPILYVYKCEIWREFLIYEKKYIKKKIVL
jgi:hypothetical protein